MLTTERGGAPGLLRIVSHGQAPEDRPAQDFRCASREGRCHGPEGGCAHTAVDLRRRGRVRAAGRSGRHPGQPGRGRRGGDELRLRPAADVQPAQHRPGHRARSHVHGRPPGDDPEAHPVLPEHAGPAHPDRRPLPVPDRRAGGAVPGLGAERLRPGRRALPGSARVPVPGVPVVDGGGRGTVHPREHHPLLHAHRTLPGPGRPHPPAGRRPLDPDPRRGPAPEVVGRAPAVRPIVADGGDHPPGRPGGVRSAGPGQSALAGSAPAAGRLLEGVRPDAVRADHLVPVRGGDYGTPAVFPNSPPLPSPLCLDGVCEVSRGESGTSCPLDCPPACGDAVCQQGENTKNCPGDCRLE